MKPIPDRPDPPADASPVMRQWFASKATHPEALLFFRMGDFFELFFADAEAAAAALDIQLTSRGEHAGAPIPMCGVPVATAELYLARLIRRGFRVAIVEQMETPQAARARGTKAPIRREVVRLITPGTLVEDTLLDATRPNRLLALAAEGEGLGAAWLDISTGTFETEALANAALPALLARLDPAEILADAGGPALAEWAERRAPTPPAPTPDAARRNLAEAFEVASIDAFGCFSDAEAVAAARALDYVRATQAGSLPLLAPPRPQGLAGTLAIDAATRTSLEITRARDGETRHCLLGVVQHTLSAPGARLLAAWLDGPLTDADAIAARQDAWVWLIDHPATLAALRAALRGTPDMARALARLALGRFLPRDLAAVRDGLGAAHAAARALVEADMPLLAAARRALDVAEALRAALAAALAPRLPARLEDGGVIGPGFDAELDAERHLRDEARQIVAGLQLDYAQRYGVASLKLRHHAQLGYVIEVPAAAVARLRDHPELVLRQSLATGARFGSADLAALGERIAAAEGRAAARERTVIEHLRAQALEAAAALTAAAAALAALDVLQSAARLAEGGAWCRPRVRDGFAFHIEAGRHPVVEAALAGRAAFVPNDCDLAPERRVLLLTGPNMAGKSTFLRQNALIVVLAQAGLPVPARSAEIGIVDRLFSRVGAADDLARGRSTFMVEMTETAAILRQAGPRSLVVVDEIGRGTATLDGLAIAWAVLEALHSTVRARTLFATHFHELARLQGELPMLAPHTMRVREWKGEVVFLHEVAAGAGGRSWGVHVARLAGVPAPVVRRAAALLALLEERGAALTEAAELPLFARAAPAAVAPETPAAPAAHPVLAALAALRPDQMTPRDAIEAIYRLHDQLRVTAPSDTAKIGP